MRQKYLLICNMLKSDVSWMLRGLFCSGCGEMRRDFQSWVLDEEDVSMLYKQSIETISEVKVEGPLRTF